MLSMSNLRYIFTKQTTSSNIFYDAETESKTCTAKLFPLYERRYLKNWMNSIMTNTKEQTLLKKVAIYDFESIFVPSEEL